MAGETPNTTPDPLAGTASAGNAAAPTAAPAAGAPSLGQQVEAEPTTSGAANQQVAQGEAMQAAENQNAAAAQARQAAAQSVAPPPPGPHARLFNMIEALGVTLNATGKVLATRGKEGGAPEIENYVAQKQQQAIQAQNARTALRDENVRIAQQAMATAAAQYQMWHNISMLPNQVAMSDLNVKRAQQELTAGAAAFQAQHGVTPDVWERVEKGEGTAEENQAFNTRAVENVTSWASQFKDNPTLQTDLKTVSDPAVDTKTKVTAYSDAMNAYNNAQAALKTQGAQTTLAGKAALNATRTDLFAEIDAGKLKLSDPDTQKRLGLIANDPTADPPQRARATQLINAGLEAEKQKQADLLAIAKGRGVSYADAKAVEVRNPDGTVGYTSAGDAKAQHLPSATVGDKIAAAHSYVYDMRQGINELKADANAVAGSGEFSPAERVKLSQYFSKQGEGITQDQLVGWANANLTPQQSKFVSDVAQMRERIMSIRSLGSMGQGSDSQREEIMKTLPSVFSMTNPKLVQDQINGVSSLLDNMEAGLGNINTTNPKLKPGAQPPPTPAAGVAQKPAGATVSVTDPQGGTHWFATQAAADSFKKLAGIK